MLSQEPSVIRLDTHLEDQNAIIYSDDDQMGDVKLKNKFTKRTACFELNKIDTNAKNNLYNDIPKYYVSKSDKRVWQRRSRNKISNIIGRMYFISPNDVERYCMRLLLLNVSWATSFENLRTVNSIPHLSFQSCAIFLGFLEDEKAYHDTLNEAASITTDSNK